MSVLEEIVAATRQDVARRQRELPQSELERELARRGEDRPFSAAVARPGMSVIAEHKRSSPSAGRLGGDAEVADIVRAYERGGAAALSIVTEPKYFDGSLTDLREARRASALPILRKDFIVDPYQLYESVTAGADAILLIVAALSPDALAELHGQARALDLDVLVEVHDEEQLHSALAIDADVIAINNRDLTDFSVDVQRTFDLLSDVPTGKAVVSESGFSSRDELDELERVGVDAVLVGETLMRADDPEAACSALSGERNGAE